MSPRNVEIPKDEEPLGAWRIEMMASAACAFFGVAGWLSPSPWLAFAFYAIAYVAGSWFAAVEMWEKLQERDVDVHFLMLAVALGAASIGEWNEGVVLLFLFSASGALESFAMERTQREVRSLIHAAPKTASVIWDDGTEHEVPLEEITAGTRVLVRPGSLCPVDAEITRGETATDESTLTGEAVPVEKRPGDTLLAGTLNLWGSVEATAIRAPSESALQKIIHLIREAQRQKAPAQRFTDRFGSTYTVTILALTAGMFLFWWLALGYEPFVSADGKPSAFYQAMTLLVVASPCALVLSVPSAILAAIAWGARHGVLFRGGVAVEQLAQVKVVAMDKTGTLTTGELKVELVESFPPGREREVAELAYAMERLSTHPLARAITAHGRRNGLDAPEVVDFSSLTGQGLEARQGSVPVRLGRRHWVLEGVEDPGPTQSDGEFGVSEVWLRRGDLIGRVRLRDEVRKETPALVAELKKRDLHPVVLTGDHAAAAEHLREKLALEDIRAGLTPDEKLKAIGDFVREGRPPAMIGDGVNDAPSLAAAHIGVAMGARGSDAALEQADVVLMHDRLENFLAAYDLSKRARAVIYQNVIFALGVVVVLVGFAMAGRIPLTLGVIGHEGSTLLVVLNSLRLLLSPAAGKHSLD
ncbi:MAG: heavy metal translocating P-type ATPase [Chthoniobacteraceae bacterium]